MLQSEQTDGEDGGRKITIGYVLSIMSSRGRWSPSGRAFTRYTAAIAARFYWGSRSLSQLAGNNVFSCCLYLDFERMDASAQRQKRREFVLSSLNTAIEASNLAKELCNVTPAKLVFACFSVILTMIKVGFFLRRLY
jgi:hypothetical protein